MHYTCMTILGITDPNPCFKLQPNYFIEGGQNVPCINESVSGGSGSHEVSNSYDVIGVLKAKEAELTCRIRFFYPTISHLDPELCFTAMLLV